MQVHKIKHIVPQIMINLLMDIETDASLLEKPFLQTANITPVVAIPV